MTQTLTGEVLRVTFENEETGFRVVRVGVLEDEPRRGQVTLVGNFQAVGPGTRVRATGRFVTDARRGEQFKVESMVALAPETLLGLERYLSSGVIPGVGPGFAKRIVKAFGEESLRVLDAAPERLREVRGLGARRAKEIGEAWQGQRELSNIMLLLQTYGASPRLAQSIVKRYGARAQAIVQTSPHRLALEMHGVGFKTADRIASALGIARDHPERAQAGAFHQLRSFSDHGDVYVERHVLCERSAEMLGIDEAHVDAAIDALWAQERVVVEETRIFLRPLHEAEQSVAARISQLSRAPGHALPRAADAISDFEQSQGLTLAALQRQAVELAAQHKVGIITGGPGVGKTTIVRAVVSVLEQAKLRVKLVAPTGRAAKRLSESTGRPAGTIHRLLEYDPRLRTFQRKADSPVEADAVVVDEASMLDIQLASSLLEAIPDHARVLWVGDNDQLPPVGPGAPLRDLIESRAVPCVRLHQIFRQAGQSSIVENAHRILEGELPESAEREELGADFFVIPRPQPEEAARLIEELVCRRIPKRFGFDPRSDIFVLTPMHRGPAGTEALNRRLQAALNPNADASAGAVAKICLGDRVMQVKNDYDKEVFNGDMGVVSTVDAESERVVVRFDGRDVTYTGREQDALVLAYATSIHKSQGSEYPVVVMPLLTSHYVMLSRNLLYTGVTRAKKLCVLISDRRALGVALAETRKEDRQTRLRERLQATAGEQATPNEH